MRPSHPLITALATIVLGMPAELLADAPCGVRLCSVGESSWCFRAVAREGKSSDRQLLTFLRTNPGASLACLREQVDQAGGTIREIGEAYSGIIGGDVKPDNVDIVRVARAGDWQIGLIDLDDGGEGSLFLDLLHTLVYDAIWNPSLDLPDALDAYRLGLANEDLRGVPTLKAILGEQRRSARSCRDVERRWARDLNQGRIRRLADAPRAVSEVYDGPTFERELQRLLAGERDAAGPKARLSIEDQGFSRKESSGGSLCVPRFVYRVRLAGGSDGSGERCEIVEFKQQTRPAAAATSPSHAAGADHRQRLAALNRHYRPLVDGDAAKADPGNVIGVVDVAGQSFLVRYARPELFDSGEASRKDALAYAKRMFHWLGQVHAAQGPEYAKRLDTALDDPKVVGGVRRIIQAHVAYLERLAQRGAAYRCPD
ncbi:hypothetical protein [Accumulibacter sp.]|uniref:hypothetical protein n=1 Tax=Accumulibacter sp. TaxID=2053492 RepID=UPI0025DCA20A|nr:hypothetical protein [Accumulibacter sp.]MCM8594732.1 hypothetical protein [Accumulibacter sp.]MCM8625852.1 hypothetical protein [Accumulibacter sp.]MDS4048878.1 hypothetical protein [Accumulibacter sp.]